MIDSWLMIGVGSLIIVIEIIVILVMLHKMPTRDGL